MAAPALKYPAVRSELPSPDAWLPFLEPAYAANYFSNFGEVSLALERKLAAIWGGETTGCVLASSGTSAIAAPLIAYELSGPVIIPAFAFAATLSAVRMAACAPYLVDVQLSDWRMSAATLEAAFQRTAAKAAIVLAPFGLRSHFEAHAEVAKRHGALLIIDNAAGLGIPRSCLEHQPQVFECYSLHATKPFGIGEGGTIFAHRDEAERLRSALNFGFARGPEPAATAWGINGKLSEFQAAVGHAVCEGFGARLQRRQQVAARYIALLSRYQHLSFERDASASPWQLFPVLGPDAAFTTRLVEISAQRGLELRRYYRPPLSRSPAAWAGDPCPASEALSERMFCLPIYSNATENELEEMCAILRAALDSIS